MKSLNNNQFIRILRMPTTARHQALGVQLFYFQDLANLRSAFSVTLVHVGNRFFHSRIMSWWVFYI